MEQTKLEQTHIDNGNPEKGKSCPIARALKSHPNITHADVGDIVTCITFNRRTKRLENNDLLTRFVYNFDKGEQVTPGTIEFYPDQDDPNQKDTIYDGFIYFKPEVQT